MPDRYDTSGNIEDEYYPGTAVLKNREEIRDSMDLLERETEFLVAAYEEVFTRFDESLTADLRFFYSLHNRVFGALFEWAGRPRTVQIAKGSTPFCPSQNIAAMLHGLFAELKQHHWLSNLNQLAFLQQAARYMCEINAVHPFREGNGRIIRFYVDVLAARVHGDLFDWTKTSQEEYLQACVVGFGGDYRLMVSILQRCATFV
ncbi:MAG: Fic/DOC family protein [Pyrinomonadaceae bacterium]